MKRDMDLIRQLLLQLQEVMDAPGVTYGLELDEEPLLIEGYSPEQVGVHMVLLIHGGFIDCAHYAGGDFGFKGITWEGHDFLDSVRDPEVWSKTKQGAMAAGGFTVDLLKDLAKGLVKKQIEDRTGVKL